MIKNKTKKTVIAERYYNFKSPFSKAIGLMFSMNPKNLIFIFKKEKIIPLHMFFVIFPIDVLFLDKNKKVVDLKENFRPFTFYTPKAKAKYVIELSKGAINKSKTKLNDNISF
jgi:uncharacterized membrane protein (UPF0127 family)